MCEPSLGYSGRNPVAAHEPDGGGGGGGGGGQQRLSLFSARFPHRRNQTLGMTFRTTTGEPEDEPILPLTCSRHDFPYLGLRI
jgi:hypothetical protein